MIAFVDPGARTTNLGDQVISASVRRHLIDPILEAGVEVVTIPLHGHLSDRDRGVIRGADDVLVCGTNLLSDHAYFRSPWHWSRSDISLAASKLTMFGVGWWQYQRAGVDLLTARWFRKLASDKPWAVRDRYSLDRLQRAGVDAIHLSCPTLWGLSEQLIPGGEGTAVITLTDYNQDPLADDRLLARLEKTYSELLYWPQGPGDAAYLRRLRPQARVLEPTLAAFDAAMTGGGGADYIGLRLHAGIRAMQLGRPSLPLSIDNRAREISSSVGLVAPSRNDLRAIEALLTGGSKAGLRVPEGAIEVWRQLWFA